MKKILILALLVWGLVFTFGFVPEVQANEADLIDIASELKEGDVVGSTDASDPDLFIVNKYGHKRLFLNPRIFNLYGHLSFNNVRRVSPELLDLIPTSGIFMNCEGTSRQVYALEVTAEDDASLNPIALTDANLLESDPNFYRRVFCINNLEQKLYSKATRAYVDIGNIPTYERNRTVIIKLPVILPAPNILSIEPISGPVGTRVKLIGTNIGQTRSNGQLYPVVVNFDGHPLTKAIPSKLILNTDGPQEYEVSFSIPSKLTETSCTSSAIAEYCAPIMRLVPVKLGSHFITLSFLGKESNAHNFVVTSKNQSPSINEISGPTALRPFQQGTWKIEVSDPEGDDLKYRVLWGDLIPRPLNAISSEYYFGQVATFTHSYNKAGVYYPTFYVTDSAGNVSKTSISVKVGDSKTQTPEIISTVPSSGSIGTKVILSVGGASSRGNLIYMNGLLAASDVPLVTGDPVVSASGSLLPRQQLFFEIPPQLAFSPDCLVGNPQCLIGQYLEPVVPGVYKVTFKTSNREESNSVKLIVE